MRLWSPCTSSSLDDSRPSASSGPGVLAAAPAVGPLELPQPRPPASTRPGAPLWSSSWWFFSSFTARWAWPPSAPSASSPELLPVTGGTPGGCRPDGWGGSCTGGPCAACDRCCACSCCCCERGGRVSGGRAPGPRGPRRPRPAARHAAWLEGGC